MQAGEEAAWETPGGGVRGGGGQVQCGQSTGDGEVGGPDIDKPGGAGHAQQG